jgi:hypothetical protein
MAEFTLQGKLDKMAANIKGNLAEMQSVFMDISFRNEHIHSRIDKEHEQYYEAQEISQQLEEQFIFLTNRAYMSGLVFFELQKLSELRSEFMAEMGDILQDREKVLASGFAEDAGEEYSKTLQILNNYFSPFAEFIENAEMEQHRLSGRIYMEIILRNTAQILRFMSVQPTREEHVYNAVKIVLTSTFPKYLEPTFPFLKEAKEYKPDILLPSLETAIEYKYAENEKELNKTIDQIMEDVRGYSEHHQYNHFYAVFYVTVGQVGQERFDVLWNSKKFPSNWHPIFIQGY